jgi:hypothetical protein
MQTDMTIPPHIQVVQQLRAAEFHWHFSQSLRAIESQLYIPGCIGLLTGIEASLRFTLYQFDNVKFPFDEDLGQTLSNALLRTASLAGLPVGSLAFPGEPDFFEKLESRSPYVELVRVRHNLAHGNIQEYVNRDLGDENAFFTPECLRSLASLLEQLAGKWVTEIAAFRSTLRKA